MATIFGLETGVDFSTAVSSNFGGTLTIILAILVFALACAIGIYIWWTSRIYNIKVMDFENVAGGGFQLVHKDKARLVKMGVAGEEILYLRKRKTYRSAYGKKMGKNQYWFAKGQDGYWYNFLLGDLDAKMGMLDIEPIDRDMRYMHTAIARNIEDRYRKQTFMDKWGQTIFNFIFLFLMILALWFLIDKIGDLIEQLVQASKVSKETTEVIKVALSKVDTICSGGAGYTPT